MGPEARRKGGLSGQKALALGLSAAVLIVVGAGLWVSGSPKNARLQQLDERRVDNLHTIGNAVNEFYRTENRLPESQAELSDPVRSYYFEEQFDPETKESYEYRVTGSDTYEVCATFAMSSEEDEEARLRPRHGYGFAWKHPAGHHCFKRVAFDSDRTCSITSPCAEGQSCVRLPQQGGAYCVPQGLECEAANCADSCVIAESYPAQVRCSGFFPGGPTTEPPQERPDSCQLMQEEATGKVDCFGCADGICSTPSSGWKPFERAGGIGIPYACYSDGQGCQLAQ